MLSALADARRPGQVLIGFAAEHGEGALAHARGKLERKGLDAVVLNDVSDPSIGFDSAENEVVDRHRRGRRSTCRGRPRPTSRAPSWTCS